MKILADGSLPLLQEFFKSPLELTLFHNPEELQKGLAHHELLLCRTTLQISEALLKHSAIRYVATASSGTDHLDINYLQHQHIPFFSAKGCNAVAVADYIVAMLALLSTEGHALGAKAGVIGVGEVGSRVMQRLQALGLEVISSDPLQDPPDPLRKDYSLNELVDCDVICLHANVHDNQPHSSRNLINHAFLSQLKPGTILINAARGELVDELALLTLPYPIIYCSDVFLNEPNINQDIVTMATHVTTHIAGHSIEGKIRAVQIISEKIHHYFGLTPPSRPFSETPDTPVLSAHLNWQKLVLSLYNPLDESMQLKSQQDKTQSFLTLRKAHTYRHDFVYYNATQLNLQERLILGQPKP